MRFEADRAELQKALSIVEGIIPTREIRSVISNVLIEIQETSAIFTATDLEIAVRTSISVANGKKGRITVPAKKLSQSIREFKGSRMALEIDGSDHVVLHDPTGVSKARITFMGAPGDDFPTIPNIDNAKFSKFSSARIMEMIRKTSYAIAEEDARYVFNGLFLTSKDKHAVCVATDGRRLSRVERDLGSALPFKGGIILPGKAVRELMKLLGNGEETAMAFDDRDRRAHFRMDNIDLICKPIDGQFPDYEQVIPQKVDEHIPLDRSQLETALRQVAVMAGDPSRQVRMTFSQNSLTITASTPDLGEATDTITCGFGGAELTIAFNSNYVMDVIRVLDSEKITLGFSSASAPTVITEENDPHFIAVIMPMKI